MKALGQAINHGLILDEIHRVIERKKAWLKPYIVINTELRINAKNDL